MATNTYVALQTQTLASAASSVTFSSIPQGYTDLIIVAAGLGSGNTGVGMQFNGDTTSTYSATFLEGNGSSASSERQSNTNYIRVAWNALWDASTQSNLEIAVQNYSNTTTYKTSINRANNSGRVTGATVGLWRSTAAITSIKLETVSANFAAGSTFTIYGIASQAVATTAKATGGTITYDAYGYVYHTFTSNGTFTPSETLSCDYLIVAGGGGGGYQQGGGGGAGGYRSASSSLTATGYTVTIGAGGGGSSGGAGSNGVDSSIATILTSTGGGGGGGRTGANAGNGGSGGGAGLDSSQGTGTSGQGFAGGVANGNSGAGGGGASAAGTAAPSTSAGGSGGNGLTWYNGSTYAGGGGGGTYTSSGGGNQTNGGTGGGGGGGFGASNGAAGTANTGGGGGGGGQLVGTLYNGAAGGSGLVIIRYSGV